MIDSTAVSLRGAKIEAVIFLSHWGKKKRNK